MGMEKPEEFMKKTAFYAFESGVKTTALKPKDTRVLDAFHHEHMGRHRSWEA